MTTRNLSTRRRCALDLPLVLVLMIVSGCAAPAGTQALPTTQPAPTSAPIRSAGHPPPTVDLPAPALSPSTRGQVVTSSAPPSVISHAAARARRRIAVLTKDLGARGVSVAAYDVDNDTRFATGVAHGMSEGSIAKLDIIETLLWQRQKSGTTLDEHDEELAEAMIEDSDNDAADDLWTEVGGRRGVARANRRFGLDSTVLGTGLYWGLSTTSANDQLILLGNLLAGQGPLTRRSKRFVFDLMRDVESDQRWGVGVVADPGTRFANKNGWLSLASDGGRWLVNSLGVLRVHRHTVLLAVLTQHNDDFDDGIDRTEQIATAVVPALDR